MWVILTQNVAHHARTFERLCEGQLNETFGPTDDTDRVDFYLQVLADKTGSLVSTAASFGALLSGAGSLMGGIVADFGEKVGVAFQIADDVLDLGEQSGKTPGTDLREGVDTLPVLLLRRREATGTIDEAGLQILRDLDGDLSSDKALASVVERLCAHDVLDQTRELARTWANDAIAALAPQGRGQDRARSIRHPHGGPSGLTVSRGRGPLRCLARRVPASLYARVLRVGAWGGRRPARSPSAPRAWLGASSRSPARPCRRPQAPEPSLVGLSVSSIWAAPCFCLLLMGLCTPSVGIAPSLIGCNAP